MQVEHGDAQADRRVLDGEKRFFLLGHAEAEARVLREAVAFAGDAEEILIELFVPVLVVIECDRIAAGGRGLQAQRRLAFTGIHADAVEAGAFLQESLGVVGIEDRGYQALGAAHLLDRRSEEHTSELQSLMRNSYAVFCLKKKNKISNYYQDHI